MDTSHDPPRGTLPGAADFAVTIATAHGPRARVVEPAFPDTVPVLAVTVEAMPGDAANVRMPFFYLDLEGRPAAADIVRGRRREGSMLSNRISLLVHETGNGYVGLEVIERDERADEPAGHSARDTRSLRLAIDPSAHAAELAAAVAAGRLCLVERWIAENGDHHRSLLPRTVNGDALERITQDALTHPRTVMVSATGRR